MYHQFLPAILAVYTTSLVYTVSTINMLNG